MTKIGKQTTAVVAIVLVAYLVLAFAVPFVHNAIFWLSLVCTVIAIAAQLYILKVSFDRGESVRSKFYGFPIARIGVIYLGVQLVFSFAFMCLAAFVPMWIAIIVYVLVLACSMVGMIAADAMRDEIERQDIVIKKSVSIMRSLQSQANQLVGMCSGEAQAAVKKFAEKLRFSDPVSSDSIKAAEADLQAVVDELQQTVVADGDVVAVCRRAEVVLAERNRLCKLAKGDDEQNYALRRREEEKRAQEAERQAAERRAEARRAEAERAAKTTRRVIAITVPVVCILVAAFIVLTLVVIPGLSYKKAVSLMDSGKYVEAKVQLESMKDYKDSEKLIEKCEFGIQKSGIVDLKVGNTVKFGFYEQDGKSENGAEEIAWDVIAVKGNRALLVSRYAIACAPYNTATTGVTWEISTLRSWLNNDFAYNAFSEYHRGMIAPAALEADVNPDYETMPGSPTTDSLFVLSMSEAYTYFDGNGERACTPTDAASAIGAGSQWWLRTPGESQSNAAIVDANGAIVSGGTAVNDATVSVRPAMWIDLSK